MSENDPNRDLSAADLALVRELLHLRPRVLQVFALLWAFDQSEPAIAGDLNLNLDTVRWYRGEAERQAGDQIAAWESRTCAGVQEIVDGFTPPPRPDPATPIYARSEYDRKFQEVRLRGAVLTAEDLVALRRRAVIGAVYAIRPGKGRGGP